MKSKRLFLATLIGVLLVYLAAAFGSALTQRPWCDEAWFSSPALMLITKGSFGTPVLDPGGIWFPLTGINQYTYWIMPLHPFSQAPWYKIFGFGVLQMRAYSIMWGLVALASWLFIMKVLSNGNRKLALLCTSLIAFDYIFIQRSSEGRMDIMSAALGFAAIAAYLGLRKRNLLLAVVVSHTLVVASAFTHPNALMHFLGLGFLTIYYDRQNLRWRHVFAASPPYVIGATMWALYISRAPDLFRIQFSGNATGRFQGLRHPLSSLKLEFSERYSFFLAGFGPELPSIHSFKILILVAYVVGIVGALSIREIRQQKGFRSLLVLTAINFLVLTFFDGTKNRLYLIHIIPLFAATLGVFVWFCWQKALVPRWLITAALFGLVALQLSGVIHVIKRDNYGKTYRPAIAFLKQHARPDASIMGSSDLGFGLGFFGNLTDDLRLGYYTGKTPDFIVVEGHYKQWFRAYSQSEPKVYEFIVNRLANEYQPVYVSPPYTIYARVQPPSSSSSGN